MQPFQIPADPLVTFSEIFTSLNARRSWTTQLSPLRYSALTLATCGRPADELAEDLFEVAEVLQDRAGWFGPLNSPIRFCVAAMLVRGGDDPSEFCDFVDDASAQMRDLKLRSGSIYETVALLILHQLEKEVSFNRLIRFRDIYQEMKKHHWWLTGTDDYPACALLATGDDSPGEVSRRVELYYEGLRNLGFSRGEKLQMISHILYFNPHRELDVLARFQQLHAAFKEAGLWIHQGDWDEIAILTFLDHDVRLVVRRVLEHRESIKKLKPSPDADTSFSLACGTAFLDLVRLDERLRLITDASALAQVQSILAAQQAAIAGSIAATTAVIAASSSSS